MREFKLYNNINQLLKICKGEQINKIPEDFHKFYEDLLVNVPNKQINTKLPKKLSVIAASMVVLLFTFSGITIAQNSEAIKNLYKKFYAPTEYKEYSKEINTTVKLGDIDITINDLVFDNNFLLINYTASIAIDKKIEDYMIRITPQPELPNNSIAVISDNEVASLNLGAKSISIINLYQLTFTKDIEMLPDKFRMRLDLSAGQNNVTTPTQVNTKSIYLDVDKANLSGKFKVVNINKAFNLPNGKLLYDKMAFSPFGAVLQFKSSDIDFTKKEYLFLVCDEKGNEIKSESIGTIRMDDYKLSYSKIRFKPQAYEGLDKLVIKAVDTKTGKTIDGLTVTLDIPKLL